MPSVTRLGDLCTGHGCFPARKSVSASPNVFVNGIAAHRLNDAWEPHGCPTCTPHSGILAAGSSTVHVNGKAIGRIGDPVDCGSNVAEGSSNVFAN
tara:strand:+ start:377 stop:664 length:288 start_codon:yes stop_codon:yes gene_type:complete